MRETFHDMRQPVAIMMALAAAAFTDPGLPAAVRHRLEQIIEQAEWLSDMIHGCLTAQQQEEPDETGNPGGGLADIVYVVGTAIDAECLTWPGDITLAAPTGPVWCTVDPVLLPPGSLAIERLLTVFELEKSVYELRYELDNRPDWVVIPVAGIQRLIEQAAATP